MNKYVLAVSGGVDSVVLLDMLSKQPDFELVVAHFDHGIRDDSGDDAVFVAELAKKYGLPFETRREELGKKASEELARSRRYKFLREVARKYNAKLVTAHHADDVVETITINLIRGTGWRGLASMDSDVTRPLTHLTKYEILDYAKKNNLSWRDDSTNNSDDYLRNRIRHQMSDLDSDIKSQLLGLWAEQRLLKRAINQEVNKLISDNSKVQPVGASGVIGPTIYDRYFFTHIDAVTGMECLRQIVNGKLTRPQLEKSLHAIKTAKQHKKYHAGGGIELNFTSRNFTVELVK